MERPPASARRWSRGSRRRPMQVAARRHPNPGPRPQQLDTSRTRERARKALEEQAAFEEQQRRKLLARAALHALAGKTVNARGLRFVPNPSNGNGTATTA